MASTATLDDFDQLLEVARQQKEPQRLLFVFVRREPGAGAGATQPESSGHGEGGYLQPALCVDKRPEEVANFASLLAESAQTGQHWDIVFVGSLDGRGGIAPSSDEADQPLRFMISAINDGRVSELAAFNREGSAIRFI